MVILVVMLVFSGKLKSFSIGNLKIEGNPNAVPAPTPEAQIEQTVKIGVSGRWQSRQDQPGEKFDKSSGIATPATVTLKPGEIYSFRADFGLTDEDFQALATLANYPQIRFLNLYNCKHLSEDGLSGLQKFRHLWDLDLAETNTTDKVLEALQSLTSLKILMIKGCQVSPDSIERLQKALPNCKVRT